MGAFLLGENLVEGVFVGRLIASKPRLIVEPSEFF